MKLEFPKIKINVFYQKKINIEASIFINRGELLSDILLSKIKIKIKLFYFFGAYFLSLSLAHFKFFDGFYFLSKSTPLIYKKPTPTHLHFHSTSKYSPPKKLPLYYLLCDLLLKRYTPTPHLHLHPTPNSITPL